MKLTPKQNEILELAHEYVGTDPCNIIPFLCDLVLRLTHNVSTGFVRVPSAGGNPVQKKPPDPLSK